MKPSRNGRKSAAMRVYSNLSNRKLKKDIRSRRKAEYLASLPKDPIGRFFYRMNPKRLAAFWFSREGGLLALKIVGVFTVIMAILVGGLFAYYRRELSAISPEELSKRVQTTVSRYYDRNGVLLYEDKGSGNYKLVVKSEEISKYLKQATVAIEDRDFYKHGGVSFTGIVRAGLNDVSGGSTQGGSTLTQQLIKQVFFADQAGDRGLSGVPRKIKEIILSIEVERMYNKDQILSLYLNESPYGGPRNGAEAASQEYFGKPAKDLTIPEAALLAGIPQSPGLFNPRNADPVSNKALLKRQQDVLTKMAEQGYITSQQATDAKKVAILDEIKAPQPLQSKAPHFIQMVQAQLKSELGTAVVGQGGLTVKTTLDYRAQQIVEKSLADLFASSKPRTANFDNGSATVIDTQTGQIIALQGSRDYSYPGYGQVNSADAFIQPGSSVKPFVYASLFKQKAGVNYGAGSIIPDLPLPQSFYTTDDGKPLADFDNKFKGNMHIRSALPESRNVPAVEAMYLNDKASGQGDTIKTIQAMGDRSYCTDGQDKTVGLGAAIGSCGLKQYEHANTFATLARMGVYKPPATILEVKNGQGQVIKQWKDDQSKQVIDPQITYILADILNDDNARAPSFGRNAAGLVVPGVKTGTKTGTSNIGKFSSNLWINSFSPAMTASVWVGNHDARPMSNALSSILGNTVNAIVAPIHKNIYALDNNNLGIHWTPSTWYTQPAGVQKLNVNGSTDLYPSWYNKAQQQTAGVAIVFDSVSRKKATACTPPRAKVSVTAQNFQDPISGKTTQSAEGYDTTANDDVHICNPTDVPFVNVTSTLTGVRDIIISAKADNSATNKGTLNSIEFTVNGQIVNTQAINGSGVYTYKYTAPDKGKYSVGATVIDTILYDASNTAPDVNVLASAQTPVVRHRSRQNS